MIVKTSLSKLVNFSCASLIILIFLSKISLKWAKILPYSLPPFIFQYGIHPYINFGLQFVIAIILIFVWFKSTEKRPMSLPYKTFIYSLMAILSIQTFFQITLVNVAYSPFVQIGGLGMAIMLIWVYGIIIPSLFDLEKFIYWIRNTSTFLVISSFVCLPLFYPDMFRGGRFVGFFKHIPHMVTASTAAFIFYIPLVFKEHKWSLKKNIFINILVMLILTLAVMLTSTKAAFITIAITGFVAILILGSKKRSVRLFRFTFLSCCLVSILLMGVPTSKFLYEISTGKIGFGLRPAQDGVQTRMEEVFRGWSMFDKSPYFGLGLLYKFLNGSSEGIEVESYNSFKDPHNLFVSAAVIGGYPLFFLSIIGYGLLVYGAFNGMNSENTNYRIIGIFLLAHLPVFVIYHAHFSMGGMGDRIYWLIFGYLGVSESKKE